MTSCLYPTLVVREGSPPPEMLETVLETVGAYLPMAVPVAVLAIFSWATYRTDSTYKRGLYVLLLLGFVSIWWSTQIVDPLSCPARDVPESYGDDFLNVLEEMQQRNGVLRSISVESEAAINLENYNFRCLNCSSLQIRNNRSSLINPNSAPEWISVKQCKADREIQVHTARRPTFQPC